jgi:hypothetical protein
MPIFEYACPSESCEAHMEPFEKFLHPRQVNDPNPECGTCGAATIKLISTYSAPWTGTLDRYFDPKCDRHNCTSEGHVQWRVKSSRLADGSPEKVHIRTRQDQLEFIKAEGLEDPFGVNPNHGNEAGMDRSSSRLRGSWV